MSYEILYNLMKGTWNGDNSLEFNEMYSEM